MTRSSTIITTKVIILHRITINSQNNIGPIQQMDTMGITSINIKIIPIREQMITDTRRHARTLAVVEEAAEEEETEAVAVEKEYHKPCHQWM